MNNIVSFSRTKTVEVSCTARVIAEMIIINEISPAELFAAVEMVSSIWDED